MNYFCSTIIPIIALLNVLDLLQMSNCTLVTILRTKTITRHQYFLVETRVFGVLFRKPHFPALWMLNERLPSPFFTILCLTNSFIPFYSCQPFIPVFQIFYIIDKIGMSKRYLNFNKVLSKVLYRRVY